MSLTLWDFFEAFVSHDCGRRVVKITGAQPVILFVTGGVALEYVAVDCSNGVFCVVVGRSLAILIPLYREIVI